MVILLSAGQLFSLYLIPRWSEREGTVANVYKIMHIGIFRYPRWSEVEGMVVSCWDLVQPGVMSHDSWPQTMRRIFNLSVQMYIEPCKYVYKHTPGRARLKARLFRAGTSLYLGSGPRTKRQFLRKCTNVYRTIYIYVYIHVFTHVDTYIKSLQVERGGKHDCFVLGPRPTWGHDHRLCDIFLLKCTTVSEM